MKQQNIKLVLYRLVFIIWIVVSDISCDAGSEMAAEDAYPQYTALTVVNQTQWNLKKINLILASSNDVYQTYTTLLKPEQRFTFCVDLNLVEMNGFLVSIQRPKIAKGEILTFSTLYPIDMSVNQEVVLEVLDVEFRSQVKSGLPEKCQALADEIRGDFYGGATPFYDALVGDMNLGDGGEMSIQEMGMQDVGTQEMGIQEMGIQEMGIQDVGIQDVGIQDVGIQDAGTQDMGMQDIGMQDTTVPDRGASLFDMKIQDMEP